MTAHHDELQYERAVNEQYMQEVERLVADDNAVAREITAQQRNGQWLGTSLVFGRGPLVRPFHGRVALDLDDPVLGRSFYIGSYRADVDGRAVISFAAPMARLFYQPDDPKLDLAGHVLATRTFTSDTRAVTDYEDDVVRHGTQEPFPRTTSTSTVQPAPRPVVRPNRPTTSRPPSPPARPARAERPTEPPEKAVPSSEQPAPSTPPSDPAPPLKVGTGPRKLLRAAKTVLAAVTAPRTGRLASLLATLQPDQYELVTWPEEEHLVIQGHPGTGKTVIAAHRAAWLTDPERLERGRKPPRGSVLVIGPTREYADHITPVLADIARPGWEVTSLSAFYARLGGFAPAVRPPRTTLLETSADPLGSFVLRCAKNYDGPKDLASFTAALFGGRWRSKDRDVTALLTEAKSLRHASQQERFHPMLALAALALSDVTLANDVRHIVVDEAQDLRPIDVLILRQLVSHGVTLTLVGDMNQRHSDFTYPTWEALTEAADLGPVDDLVRKIDVGYRSTNQILRFAAGLLPSNQRVTAALRDGLEPAVVKVAGDRLVNEAIDRATELRDRLDGLIAIIATDAKSIETRLHAKDWRKGNSHTRYAWRRTPDSPEILVFEPTFARGLEFDGVVVVEPDAFPRDLGRNGVLYTSLTRATRELVVVHSKPLPKGLKAR